MKVRFALIVVAALALAATPVWSQDICAPSHDGKPACQLRFETGDFAGWGCGVTPASQSPVAVIGSNPIAPTIFSMG